MVGFSFQYLLFTVLYRLPWFVIAGVALLAFLRERRMSTLLQVIGAAILAFLLFLELARHFLIPQIGFNSWAYWMSQYAILAINMLGYIFFLVGYCTEKLRKPANGAGFPINPL